MTDVTCTKGKITTVSDLYIKQGSDYICTYEYLSAPATPIDITGADIRMQIRQHITDLTVLAEYSVTTTHITITDAVNGVFTVNIPAADTAPLEFRDATYDIEIVLAGIVDKVVRGKAFVELSVTREDI